MAVPVLSDYEYQYDEASNGGVLLNDDAAGVAATLPFIDVANVSGLDSAEFRTATSQHEGVDGSWIDTDFMQQRTIVIDGTIYAAPTSAEVICDSLKGNFEPGPDRPFYFKHPGVNQRFILGKSQGVRYDVATLRRTGQTAFQATILCGDTYIYDGTAFSNVRAANTTGNLNPGGNHNAWPVVTVTGPASSGYTVRNNTLGRTLTLNFALSSGQTAVINMRKRTVLLNGTTNRRGNVTGQFWWLAKNVNNALQFTVSGSTGSTNMTTTGNPTFN
jgi:phage-related protein